MPQVTDAAVMKAAAVQQAHAAWVQAFGSIGALLVAFAVVAWQAWRNREQMRATMRFVLGQCVTEYEGWTQDIKNSAHHRLFERTISLRHLDVPLESLLATPVGDHAFNEALIRMRKLNADVFIQIEKAKEASSTTDGGAALTAQNAILERLEALVTEARRIRDFRAR